jgi:transcriptional regulator with XRE-family HTH domain
MKEFRENLREIRKARKLTQVAAATGIGTDTRSYQRYESGSQQPTLPVLISMAQFLDTSIDYLAGLSDDPQRH